MSICLQVGIILWFSGSLSVFNSSLDRAKIHSEWGPLFIKLKKNEQDWRDKLNTGTHSFTSFKFDYFFFNFISSN